MVQFFNCLFLFFFFVQYSWVDAKENGIISLNKNLLLFLDYVSYFDLIFFSNIKRCIYLYIISFEKMTLKHKKKINLCLLKYCVHYIIKNKIKTLSNIIYLP